MLSINHLIKAEDILEYLKEMIDRRGLGEKISYNNRCFLFKYQIDPKVIFADDINARSSVILASELRTILEPMNYNLIVSSQPRN